MVNRTDEVLIQAINALTSAYVVLAESLHDKGILNKVQLAEALALIPDRLGQDLQGDVSRAILAGIQGALLDNQRIDLSGIPEWLRNALQQQKPKSNG